MYISLAITDVKSPKSARNCSGIGFIRELEEKTRQLTAKPAEVDMDKAQEAARRIVRLVCSVPFASKE